MRFVLALLLIVCEILLEERKLINEFPYSIPGACRNGGTVYRVGNETLCHCPVGFGGRLCDSIVCLNGEYDEDSNMCMCKHNWAGTSCNMCKTNAACAGNPNTTICDTNLIASPNKQFKCTTTEKEIGAMLGSNMNFMCSSFDKDSSNGACLLHIFDIYKKYLMTTATSIGPSSPNEIVVQVENLYCVLDKCKMTTKPKSATQNADYIVTYACNIAGCNCSGDPGPTSKCYGNPDVYRIVNELDGGVSMECDNSTGKCFIDFEKISVKTVVLDCNGGICADKPASMPFEVLPPLPIPVHIWVGGAMGMVFLAFLMAGIIAFVVSLLMEVKRRNEKIEVIGSSLDVDISFYSVNERFKTLKEFFSKSTYPRPYVPYQSIARMLFDKFVEFAKKYTVKLKETLLFWFMKEKEILSNVSFHLNPKDRLLIFGKSGCGKTSMLHLICGLPLKGGSVATVTPKNDLCQNNFAYCGEDLHNPNFTVRENIEYSSRLRGASNVNIDELLESFDLTEVKDVLVGGFGDKTLSAGQIERLKVAMELAAEPTILIIDEIASKLDSYTARQILYEISKYCTKKEITLIATMHRPPTTFTVQQKTTDWQEIIRQVPKDSSFVANEEARYSTETKFKKINCHVTDIFNKAMVMKDGTLVDYDDFGRFLRKFDKIGDLGDGKEWCKLDDIMDHVIRTDKETLSTQVRNANISLLREEHKKSALTTADTHHASKTPIESTLTSSIKDGEQSHNTVMQDFEDDEKTIPKEMPKEIPKEIPKDGTKEIPKENTNQDKISVELPPVSANQAPTLTPFVLQSATRTQEDLDAEVDNIADEINDKVDTTGRATLLDKPNPIKQPKQKKQTKRTIAISMMQPDTDPNLYRETFTNFGERIVVPPCKRTSINHANSYRRGFALQGIILDKYELLQIWRKKSVLLGYIALMLSFGVLIGFCAYKLKTNLSGSLSRTGVIFASLLVTSVMGFDSTMILNDFRIYYTYHQSFAYYYTISYFLGRVTIGWLIPNIIKNLVFICGFYFLTDFLFGSFLWYVVILQLSSMIFGAIGMILSSLVLDRTLSIMIYLTIVLLSTFGSGVIFNFTTQNPFLQVVKILSPWSYANENLLINEFETRTVLVDSGKIVIASISGVKWLSQMGMNVSNFGLNFLILSGAPVVLMAVAFITAKLFLKRNI